MNILARSLSVLALLVCCPAGAQQARVPPVEKIDFRNPERAFVDVPHGTRFIRVEKQLLDENRPLAMKSIERLKITMDLALDIFPGHSHPFIAKQQFWLMYGPKARGGGLPSGASYFRPGSPDSNKLLHPDWNSAVVVNDAENYLGLSELWAMKVVLHELAHAYQLEQWPEQEAHIQAAFDHAAAESLYRNVPEDTGATIETAYALSNQLEYFAELSCMYFARCNYRPFNRSELKTYDPTGYAMIREMWKEGDEHGQHGLRNWRLEQFKKPVIGTFKSLEGGRVIVALESGKERKLQLKSLSLVDQDYIRRWEGD